MTVGHMRKLLESFNDTDRLIIDNGEYEANSENEIIFAYKVKVHGEKEPRPVIICQTKNDFDVPNELEAQIERFKSGNWDEADALAELLEYGFTLDDFKYDRDRYDWAKAVGEEHGLL